ncbi:MAG: hypothetical protein GYB67_11555 [Chloroflexi bacterium]|nr:hypothetical protein [Chloroflexota bacterium]
MTQQFSFKSLRLVLTLLLLLLAVSLSHAQDEPAGEAGGAVAAESAPEGASAESGESFDGLTFLVLVLGAAAVFAVAARTFYLDGAERVADQAGRSLPRG